MNAGLALEIVVFLGSCFVVACAVALYLKGIATASTLGLANTAAWCLYWMGHVVHFVPGCYRVYAALMCWSFDLQADERGPWLPAERDDPC